MSGDDEIIIRGGKTSGEYWAEYEGRRYKLHGHQLELAKDIARWVYEQAKEDDAD